MGQWMLGPWWRVVWTGIMLFWVGMQWGDPTVLADGRSWRKSRIYRARVQYLAGRRASRVIDPWGRIRAEAMHVQIGRISPTGGRAIGPLQNTWPVISAIKPGTAWWGQEIEIRGTGFDPVLRSNTVWIYPRPVWPTRQTISGNETVLRVTVPDGATTTRVRVARQGRMQEAGWAILYVATPEPIMQDIRSVVAGATTGLVYVGGYDAGGQAKVVAVDLYRRRPAVMPTGLVAPSGDWELKPWLTRTTALNEVCAVVHHRTLPRFRIYCIEDIQPPSGTARMVLEVNGQVDVAAVDSMDGQQFYIADRIRGHVVKVGVGEVPDWDYGNLGLMRLSFWNRRTGLAAYTRGVYEQVVVTSQVEDCGAGAGTCFWFLQETAPPLYVLYAGEITDVEIARRVSEGAMFRYFWFSITGGNWRAAGTIGIARSMETRYRIFNWDQDGNGQPERLLLAGSAFWIDVQDSPGVAEYPDMWAHAVRISAEPAGVQEMLGTLDWTEENCGKRGICPIRTARVRFGCWSERYCYVRVLDPGDIAGYAVQGPHPDAGTRGCVAETEQGPRGNACDNQVWGDPSIRWGLCRTPNCTGPGEPARVLAVTGNTGEREVYVRVPERYAGDSLLVQISDCPFDWTPSGIDDVCPGDGGATGGWMQNVPVDGVSGYFIGWKRVVVEADRMFRYGGVLFQEKNMPCANEGDKMLVWDRANVQVGDRVVVFTEPRAGVTTTLDYLPHSLAEVRTVKCIHSHRNPDPRCPPPGGIPLPQNVMVVQVNKSLQHCYIASDYYEDDGIPQYPTFANGYSAGIGVVQRSGPAGQAMAAAGTQQSAPVRWQYGNAAPGTWLHAYGTYGAAPILESVARTPVGDYILVGRTSGLPADAWVMRVTTDGQVMWARTLGTPETDEGLADVAVRSDGAVLVVGWTNMAEDYPGEDDVWVVRMDVNGTVWWQKRYATPGDPQVGDERAVAVVDTGSGDWLVVGEQDNQTWVLRISDAGNVIWQKRLSGDLWTVPQDVVRTTDGDYVIAGYTASFGAMLDDGWLVRMDGNGTVEWSLLLTAAGEEMLMRAVALANGEVAAVGWTDGVPGRLRDAWVVRVNAAGQVVAQWAYGDPGEGGLFEEAYGVGEWNDTLWVTGWSEAIGLWVMRIDSNNGNVIAGQGYGQLGQGHDVLTEWNHAVVLGGWTGRPYAQAREAQDLVGDFANVVLRVDQTGAVGCGPVEALTLDVLGVATDAVVVVPQEAVLQIAVYDMSGAPDTPQVPVDDLCTGFAVTVDPADVTVAAGASVQTTVTVTSVGGFSDWVTLQCVEDTGSLQAGLSCTFTPNPVDVPGGGAATSLLTVTASLDTPEGTYGLWVEGEGRGRRERAWLTVTVTAPDPGRCACDDFPNCTRVTDGCFYRADLGDVDEPFFDAFTIVARHPTGEGEGGVPYYSPASVYVIGHRFHQIWFHHRKPLADSQQCIVGNQVCQTGGISCCNQPQNFLHVLGMARSKSTTIIWGYSHEPTDDVYVYRKRVQEDVEAFCARVGCDDTHRRTTWMVQNITAHEVAHHFGVNPVYQPGACDGKGHDSNWAWCGGPGGTCVDPLQPNVCKEDRQAVQWCLMHQIYLDSLDQSICQRTRGWVRMDCRDLLGDVSCPEQPDCTGPERASVRRARDPR